MHIVTCSNCLDSKRIVVLRAGVNEKKIFLQILLAISHVNCPEYFSAGYTQKTCLMCEGQCKQETLLRKQKRVQDANNVFGKFQKYFCFQDADFEPSTCVAWGSKRGIIWETLKRNTDFECFQNVSSFVYTSNMS